jgi:DEAD/DEAH box helicase domain-containing protein
MTLPQLLDILRSDPSFMSNVTCWNVLPAKAAQWADFPPWLKPALVEALRQHGIGRLYTHQAEAIEKIGAGKNVVVVTPTASGKTVCYNLPVLNTIIDNPQARALYLFPTKALSQDQVAELYEVVKLLGPQIDFDIKTYTFDGDTPQSARQAIRSSGHVVVTNPDMLHQGILPHHTKWIALENLRYVVIDELHNYRACSAPSRQRHSALARIAAFYGAKPQFLLLGHHRQSQRAGRADHRKRSRADRQQRRAARPKAFHFI